jgi:hypothetical protein
MKKKRIVAYTCDYDWQYAVIEIFRTNDRSSFSVNRYKVWRNSPSANRLGRLLSKYETTYYKGGKSYYVFPSGMIPFKDSRLLDL